MTLTQRLFDLWGSSKFAQSWIIGAKDYSRARQEVMDFIRHIMEMGDLPLENNPDFQMVGREPNSAGELAKHISVDQIRSLQTFFSTTKATSKYKVAVIQEADAMNVNAANCCLKILEEPPQDSFIFLITSSPNSLLPTIRSRCQKLQITDMVDEQGSEAYVESLELITDNKAFLTKLAGKIDKAWLRSFEQDILRFLSRVIKYEELAQSEVPYAKVLSAKTTRQLLQKFDKVNKIVSKAKEFDLDPRANFVLMVEEMRS